jgi:hypothetical protein
VGVGYGLVTAPAATVVIVGSGVTAQKGFEAMGLSPEAASLYAAIITAPIAAAATTSASMKQIDKTIIGTARNFFADVAGFFQNTKSFVEKSVTSEAGHFTIGRLGGRKGAGVEVNSLTSLTESDLKQVPLSKRISFGSPQEAAIGWREYQRAFKSNDLMVIGNKSDALIAEPWPQHQVLNITKTEWTEFVNDAWIQGGIDRNATFYIGSPQNNSTLNRPWGNSVFARELKQLYAAGYEMVGDYLIPPNQKNF